MAVFLAACSAIIYGIADYCGGRATRHGTSAAVTFNGQAASLVMLLVLVPLSGVAPPPASDWGWGLLAGLAGGVGLLAFYRAMASGAMTVTAPITATVSAVIPVVFGLGQGERPGALAVIGIVIAILAVGLVSTSTGARHVNASLKMIMMSVVSGCGFGFIFVLLSHTSSDAGFWPLLAMRFASVPTVAIVALTTKRSLAIPQGVAAITLASGVLDTASNGLYLLATRHGLLTVVAVVTALYPISTVVLATSLDEERLSRSHIVGMMAALAALVMVSLSRT